jgi:Winged helix DNA-binding domain
VGLAVLYPNDDLVLPSLWEALTGRQDVDWAVRDEGGRFVDWTPDMARVWSWKDELPEQRLVCAGKHLGGRASLVSLRLLPALYALTGRAGKPEDFQSEELSPIERDVAAALLENGPTSSAELPHVAGHERKRTHAAADRLQRRLVVTAAGRQERDRGWPAVILDLLPRRYGEHLRKLPKQEEARTRLAATVLRSAREISAADLAAAIGGPRKECAAALDRLSDAGSARRRDEGEYVLWTAGKP